MESARLSDASKDARVLVLAPRFPSINQPWIDTYLEQFLNQDIPFCVVNTLREPRPYQEKVDRLGLRKFAVTLETAPAEVLLTASWSFLRHPLWSARVFFDAWRLHSDARNLKKRLSAVLRAVSVVPLLSRLRSLRVVHAHNDFLGLRFLPAVRCMRVPMVITFHGLEPKGIGQLNPVKRRVLGEYASKVLVNTQFAQTHASEVGFPTERIAVLPQGLPLEDFPFRPAKPPEPGAPLRVLSVGRFHRDKGQVYSLLSLARQMRNGYQIEWHFVGSGPDRKRLTNMSRRLGIDNSIFFHQGISAKDLLALYHSCHVFVLASVSNKSNKEHTETQGVVLQEAQATGCIPVATRVGGIPECINHGKDGLLVEDRSHRAIFVAVERLLESQNEWSSIQRAGRCNVEERFSALAVGRKMTEFLEGAAGSSIRR